MEHNFSVGFIKTYAIFGCMYLISLSMLWQDINIKSGHLQWITIKIESNRKIWAMQCNAFNRHWGKNHIKLATRSLATFNQNPPLEKKYRKSYCEQRFPYSFIHTISNGFYPFNIYPFSLLSHVREIRFIFHRLFFFHGIAISMAVNQRVRLFSISNWLCASL